MQFSRVLHKLTICLEVVKMKGLQASLVPGDTQGLPH